MPEPKPCGQAASDDVQALATCVRFKGFGVTLSDFGYRI